MIREHDPPHSAAYSATRSTFNPSSLIATFDVPLADLGVAARTVLRRGGRFHARP